MSGSYGLGSYIDGAGVKRPNVGMVAVRTDGSPVEVGGTPVQTFEDQRVLDAQGYTVSTSIVSLAANNYLVAELENAADSGVNWIMTARVFGNNVIGGQPPLEYMRYGRTSVINTANAPTVVPIRNRLEGAPVSPKGQFRWNMATVLPSGTATSSGFVPTNGNEKRIKDIVIIPPGSKLIYALSGPPGLMAAVRASMTFLFYAKAV